MTMKTKPRIKFVSKGLGWLCHDNYLICAYGYSPYMAYLTWAIRESQRNRVPRRGSWNKKSCMDWYRQGCKTIHFYYTATLNGSRRPRQIFGYDPSTDELILRG
jgi:hypothetical protein